jgi:chromosome segregation ATPase
VTVKLTNRGPEAYRHDEFGDEITIERRISKEGNSGYKLINAKGHTVSTSSKDLRQMLDQFDIQVDNPCNVLYQDTARQFLRNSKPEVKYQLFMKATQLDQMQKDFSKTQFHLENMERLLAKKEARLPELKSKIDELKTVMDELERIEKDKVCTLLPEGFM